MSEARPRVAAVVVSYDGKAVVRQAVASLRRMRYPAWELVVVDNGSRDGTREALQAEFPDLTILRLEENRGSAAGYAFGFDWAFAHGFDYALLLNNDIEVEPDLLDELVRAAESDPAIGCVGPKCYYHADRRRLWSAGGVLGFRESITRERGMSEIDRGQYDVDADVDYVNGCAILIRRAAARAAGGWDPVYFICVDDADFCTRVRRAGLRCRYAHRAVLYHMVALTTGPYSAPRNFQWGRSTAIYVRRYAGLWSWITFLAWTAVALPAAFLRELPRRNARAVLAKVHGLWAGMRMELPPAPRPESRSSR